MVGPKSLFPACCFADLEGPAIWGVDGGVSRYGFVGLRDLGGGFVQASGEGERSGHCGQGQGFGPVLHDLSPFR